MHYIDQIYQLYFQLSHLLIICILQFYVLFLSRMLKYDSNSEHKLLLIVYQVLFITILIELSNHIIKINPQYILQSYLVLLEISVNF